MTILVTGGTGRAWGRGSSKGRTGNRVVGR